MEFDPSKLNKPKPPITSVTKTDLIRYEDREWCHLKALDFLQEEIDRMRGTKRDYPIEFKISR